MGHSAHLRNQFKPINTFAPNYDFIITYQSSLCWELNGPYLWNLESPLPKDALCQVCLKLAQWFSWRRFFLTWVIYFVYYVIISPWTKNIALRLNKIKSTLPKNVLCPSLVDIGPVVLEKKIFKFHYCIFAIS